MITINKPSAKRLVAQSNGIGDVFRKILTKYDKVNTKIEKLEAEHESKIAYLQAEKEVLAQTKAANQKYVEKLNNFLN